MSTLKVANIHFEATGTNRVEYVANNINFRTGGGNFTISVGGTESLNVNASSVMISGANILASVDAAATSANLTSAWGTANAAATSANLTSAWGTANSALANTNATFAGNLTLGINQTLFVGNATVNTAISAGSVKANGVALGAGGGIIQENLYTSSQTITIPVGATRAYVQLCGGGGVGGGGASGTGGGSSILASNTQTITTLTASGGSKGQGAGGGGGGGTNGDVNYSGLAGNWSDGITVGSFYFPGTSIITGYGKGGDGTSYGTGGGGGGLEKVLTGLTPGNTLQLTIGAGGAVGGGPGTAGQAGACIIIWSS